MNTRIYTKKTPIQLTEWQNMSREFYLLASDYSSIGMPIEIRSEGSGRGKDKMEYEKRKVAIFRIYPCNLRAYYENYDFDVQLIELWVPIWGAYNSTRQS